MRAFFIPLILAAGAALSGLFARTLAPRFLVDFAQALPVATTWGTAGFVCWSILALAILAAGVIWYSLLDDPPPLIVTLVVSALSLLAALSWTPILSSDVYAYAAYGEMARLGLNPYVQHPQLRDAIVEAARWQWSGSLPVCVYGEAFVALARSLVSLLQPFGLPAILLAFRIVACAALLASAAIARGRAAFFIACNPLAIYVCAEGHNDIVMILAVLAGVALTRRWSFAGATLATAAAAIKAPALAAGYALAAIRTIEHDRMRATIAGAIAGSAIALAASWRLIQGALQHIARHGSYHTYASVQSLSPLVALLLATWILWRARGFSSLYDRAVVAACALWLAIPNPYAWYALWLLVPAAFARDRRVTGAAIAIAAASLLRYLPDAAAAPTQVASAALAIASLVAYIPLLRPRQPRYDIVVGP